MPTIKKFTDDVFTFFSRTTAENCGTIDAFIKQNRTNKCKQILIYEYDRIGPLPIVLQMLLFVLILTL